MYQFEPLVGVGLITPMLAMLVRFRSNRLLSVSLKTTGGGFHFVKNLLHRRGGDVGVDALEGFEGGGGFLKVERDAAERAVAVFGDDDFDDVFVGCVGFDTIFAVEEENNISVLFDGTRFAEIGEFGNLVGATLHTTREL